MSKGPGRLVHYMKRFTGEDVRKIIEDYKKYVPILEIARKLGRSEGVIRQKIISLHLKRDKYVMSALHWAPSELIEKVHEMEPRDWLAACYKWRENEESRLMKEYAEDTAAYVARMEKTISEIISDTTLSRTQKMIAMRAAGVTLQRIGLLYGITRERVRQLTSPTYAGPKRGVGNARGKLPEPATIEIYAERLQKMWEASPQESRDVFLEFLANQDIDFQWKSDESEPDTMTPPPQFGRSIDLADVMPEAVQELAETLAKVDAEIIASDMTLLPAEAVKLGNDVRFTNDGNPLVGKFAADLVGDNSSVWEKKEWEPLFDKYSNEDLGRKFSTWCKETKQWPKASSDS